MPFLPTDIAGLKLWLAADAITGLANADPVATWPDASGQGNDAAQATSGKRPTFRTNVLNGKPVVRFDGADDILEVASLSLGPFTVFAVFKASSAGMIYEHSANAGTQDGSWLYTTIGYTVQARRSDIQSSKNLTSLWGATGAWFLAAQTFTGAHAGHTLHLAGAAQSLSSVNAGDPGTGLATAALYVGGRVGGGFYLNGDIAELLVYDSALSSADRQAVEGYLNAKYFPVGLTQTKAVHRYGETPLPQFTSASAARWAATSGVLLTDDDPRTVYNGTDYVTSVCLEPVNETRAVAVAAATAGGLGNIATVQAYGTFPLTPDWGYKPIVEEPAVVSLAEDKVTAKGRYKGDPVSGFEFTLSDRSIDDDEEFSDFRAHHRLHLPWYFTDPETGVSHKLRFDQLRFEAERFFDRNNRSVLARKYSGAL